MKKSLFTAGVLVLSLSGCRFGNHTVNGPANNPVSGILGDTISGYYATEPESVQVSATVNGTTSSATGSTTYIPSQVTNQFSNPTAFRIVSADAADLYNPTTTDPAIQFTYTGGNSFAFSGTWQSGTLWDTTTCVLTENLAVQSSFEPMGNTPSTETLNSYQIPITGRMTMTVQVQYQIAGSTCTDSLQKMYNCYQNFQDCLGTSSSDQLASQSVVDDLYNQFIQAGVMTPTDIETVTSMTSQIQFQ